MKKLLLAILVLSFVTLVSCGKKNESQKETSESTQEKTETKKEVKDPSSSNEEKTKADELGMTAGMPNNFPTDVPQPKNAKIIGSINSSEGTIVTFETSEKVNDIIESYKGEMKKNGYKMNEEGATIVNDKGGMIGWTKDNKVVNLMLGRDEDKGITSVALTYK